MQWLGHNKTCPQCREKCMRKNVIRLFVDSSDSLSQANVELDPEEMKVNRLGVCVCVFEINYISISSLYRINLPYKSVR